MEEIDLINQIVTGTASGFVITSIGLIYFIKKSEKKDDQILALSNSVTNALIENSSSNKKLSDTLEKNSAVLEKNTAKLDNFIEISNYILRNKNGDTKNN